MSNGTLQQLELWTEENKGPDEEGKEERSEEERYLATILHKQVCEKIVNR